MGIYKPRKLWSGDALLGGVKKLYNRQEIEWKSADQERALTTIMSWTEQVVVILPTGAGKSLLFMLPCTLPDAGITILVVPLVALRGDLLRRLRELRIDHMEWLPGEKRESGLVLVTAEAASTRDFFKYARMLVSQQKLDRIVVDECHLTITAAGYRQSIVDLVTIRSLRTQFVYLTATLPPSMQAEFEERNHLLRPKVIRASSNRPNIFYMVRKAKNGQGSLLEQAAAKARDAWDQSVLFDKTRDKIILYVRTRDEARDLAELLGCSTYTARSGTATEKEAIVTGWLHTAAQPYIVATTAFAEGFDYPYIRLVINVNEPESMVLFAQESGRAGRDGKQAYSLVLLPSSWEAPEGIISTPRLPTTHDISLGKQRERQAMHRYLEGEQCFRTSLSEYLDSAEQRRWCMPEDVPCDICQQSHEEAIGPLERD
jgi:superfamily II DNA helicase RecQ